MNLGTAILITTHLVTFALLLQGFEFLLISRDPAFLKIWSYCNLHSELEMGLPLPKRITELVFSDSVFRKIAFLQVSIAGLGFLRPSLTVLVILFLLHLWMCVRFRGTFNGGSDMMIFVVLTGLLIAWFGHSEKVQQLGLVYIAIHTLISYFKAGLVKLASLDWRNGTALASFLQRSLLADSRRFAEWLRVRPLLGRLLCWNVVVWELAAIVLPFSSRLTTVYFLTAAGFHFAVYLSFGLNRFFWIWMSSWPAVIYSIGLLH